MHFNAFLNFWCSVCSFSFLFSSLSRLMIMLLYKARTVASQNGKIWIFRRWCKMERLAFPDHFTEEFHFLDAKHAPKTGSCSDRVCNTIIADYINRTLNKMEVFRQILKLTSFEGSTISRILDRRFFPQAYSKSPVKAMTHNNYHWQLVVVPMLVEQLLYSDVGRVVHNSFPQIEVWYKA